MPSPPQNPRKWRYTWEALAHMPTLRLFLFNPEVDPSNNCANLATTLRPDRRQLVVSWGEGGGGGGEVRVEVTVPVPSVLVDVGSSVGVAAREDHVEVRLVMVLPVDHPIVADFRGTLRSRRDDGEGSGMEFEDPSMPLALDSDLKSLQTGDMHFYCKTCSTKLTRKCLRNIVELPSVDWKEVADNWFGACCCSFGGISEKLVSEYITSYACTEGTCLVDPASVTICKDDMEGFIVLEDGNENTGKTDQSDSTGSSIVNDFGGCKITNTYHDNDNNDNAIVPPCGVANSFPPFSSIKENINKKETVPGHISPSFLHQKGEAQRTDTEVKELENQNPLSCMTLSVADPSFSSGQETPLLSTDHIDVSHLKLDEERNTIIVDSVLDSELYPDHFEKPVSSLPPTELVSIEFPHCCSGKINGALEFNLSSTGASSKSQQSTKRSTYLKSLMLSHNGSLGSGFMIRTSNMLGDVWWIEFLCRQCSSLLGSYPSSYDTDIPVDGGIRLFKCYVSSSMPTGGTRDIFRKHTLQRVFMNLLLENAADELSFRTIVRDVRTKSPMLKVVIVNSKVWCLTGYCFENEEVKSASNMDLQPFAKVLYSDCTTELESTPRLEEWSTKNHADEVYMMASQIKDLTENLKSARDRLPLSCSVLQGMSVSFMER